MNLHEVKGEHEQNVRRNHMLPTDLQSLYI